MDGMDQQVGGLMRVTNGRILRDGEFVAGELWVDLDTGKIVPAPPEGTALPDIMALDCKGLLVAPGFIDIQNNGSFGVDLARPGLTAADVRAHSRRPAPLATDLRPPADPSHTGDYCAEQVHKFRVQLLQHGVTAGVCARARTCA